MSALLELRGLRLEALDGTVLLCEAELALAPGEALALLGASGAGKSLLLAAVAGLLPPGVRRASGELRFDGRGRSGAELAALAGDGIAWLHQDPDAALHPCLRTAAQLLAGRSAVGAEERWGRFAEFSRRLGLAPRHGQAWPHELSGGERGALAPRCGLGRPPAPASGRRAECCGGCRNPCALAGALGGGQARGGPRRPLGDARSCRRPLGPPGGRAGGRAGRRRGGLARTCRLLVLCF